ncbi:pheophytinase, chloroplastic [Phragmites australis]|uniref:pheophytinase, chloroplastic n=1 Tax=Phragmites australis TaxID=29695 RepID=UPI002D79AD6A|nr:pheophytinase, chloroplastic [Phragmites australis]XP_062228843.1 pheophytinase, chloroplastic [Phragmites australis]
MEVVSCSHSCLALHQTPRSAWRLRGSGLGLGHGKPHRPRRSAVLCVGTTRGASIPGDSGNVRASQGFSVSDVDAALQGIPSQKAGEVEKVMIHGLPEGPDSSPISTGFWEWKPKLTVYYEKSGTENSKAPAVLFLPGFGVGTFHYEKQLRDLGRDHKVWTMDFLGQGMSLPCEDPAPSSIEDEQSNEVFWGFGQDSQPWAEELVYSIDLWHKQVQHFIEEVIREPVYIVGNSLGGFVALYFAASNPHLVKGVTLLNATPFWGFLPNPATSPRLSKIFPWAGTFPLPSFVRKLTETVWQKISDPSSIQDILKQVYADHSTNVDNVFSRIIETTQHPAAAASFASIMFAPRGQISFQEALSRCQSQGIPISLMYGREDPWVRPIWGIKVKQQVPEAPYYEISPAGHCPHDEVPEVINYLLRGWLKNLESEGSINLPFLEEPSYAEHGVSRELEFVREGSRKSVSVRLYGSKISLWSQLSSFLNTNVSNSRVVSR